MNHTEAVILVRYVRALCPQQRFDEYSPDAWHDLLGDYELDACKEAVIEIARRQPWIAPAEIITEVKRARTSKLDYFRYEPNPGETSAQFTRNLRAQIAAVINGSRPPELPNVGFPRPVLELTAGRDIPEAWETSTTTRVRSARDVSCPNPNCRADVHKPCKTPSGRRMAGYHGTRVDAVNSAA
ncbi:zinc finger domain-containing protein [Kitasatospora sp. NPDC094028]